MFSIAYESPNERKHVHKCVSVKQSFQFCTTRKCHVLDTVACGSHANAETQCVYLNPYALRSIIAYTMYGLFKDHESKQIVSKLSHDCLEAASCGITSFSLHNSKPSCQQDSRIAWNFFEERHTTVSKEKSVTIPTKSAS